MSATAKYLSSILPLVRTEGNITAAAKLLGTTRRILTYKIHKYEIVYEQFKGEE